MRLIKSCMAAAVAAAALITPTAQAGGFEIPGAGAADLGRGGAWYAKSDTALALRYNPAALARMTSMTMVDVNASLLFYDSCFERSGTYDEHGYGGDVGGAPGSSGSVNTRFPNGPGVAPVGGIDSFNPYHYRGVENPRVCNQTGPGPVPQLAFAMRLPKHEKLAISVGILAPNARGAQRYGNSDGVVETGNPDHPLAPSPTRYIATQVGNLQVFPTIGVAYALHPRLNVGVAFGWGITVVDFASATQAFGGNENFNDDIRTHLKAVDGFVPRINLSVDAAPVDGLRVMAGFQWTQSVDTHGKLTLEPHYYMSDADREVFGARPTVLDHTRLRAGQASVLSFGVNYGLPRKGGVAGEIADGLGTQVFDVELSFNYDLHGRMDSYRVNPGAKDGLPPVVVYGAEIEPPASIEIPKNWKNQYVFRLGGDVNIVPGVFALRAGTWYESSGITPGYAGLDFYLPRRIGATAGATIRIQRFDLTLGYARVFYDDTDYRESGGLVRGNAGTGEATVGNNGLIQAKMNIGSIGLRYHFK